MIKEVPFIARMIIIQETGNSTPKNQQDNSYYNPALDSECEYCLNTTAWD